MRPDYPKEDKAEAQTILKTRALYDTADFIQKYKSHILCLLEQSSVAIFHATQPHLDSLDKLQWNLICQLDLSDEETFSCTSTRPAGAKA